MKVLVVEDSPIARMVLKAVIEASGHAVITAENGLQTIAAISRERPDVVVVDLNMPGIDGLRLIRLIREGPDEAIRTVKIIALSDRGNDENELACRAGADSFLTKPVSLDVLVAAIETGPCGRTG